MKKTICDLMCGRDSRVSGLLALLLIGLVALGCTCGKGFDLANIRKQINDSSANANSNTANVDSPFPPADDDLTSDDEMPSASEIEALVKETTADFGDAVKTGDFSVIYDKASPDFQTQFTVAQLKEAFKTFISQKKIAAPLIEKASAIKPEFSPAPTVRNEKSLNILVAKGKFSTKPFVVKFEYEYVQRDGQWKLLKLVVNVT